MKRGPVPIDPDDFVGQFADLIHIAVKTDWAGSEALQDENMT